ncbi:MAG TPA: ABC transporter permease [Candidatus Woesearchaeota archaeon]|nr:ABC transporter permease [Candidatus Woesearchaeota archaeon]
MNPSEYLRIVFTSLKNRKLRSWLTILGITIGIIAIVALISLGQGMEDSFRGIFANIGSDRVIVTPGGAANLGVAQVSTSNLDNDDVKTILDTKGVDYAFGAISKTSLVTSHGESKSLLIGGVPTDKETTRVIENIDYYKVQKGRQFKEDDTYKVIIGDRIAYQTFKKDIKINDNIEIFGKKFEVVGIHQKSGNPITESVIRIPQEVFKDLTGEENFFSIFIKVDKNADPKEVAERIEHNLRKARGLKEGNEDFTVQTSNEMIDGAMSILNQVKLFVVSIATISLVVGGFGVMNTMYTAVVERTKEIGIMKAVGAKDTDILVMFAIESGTIGLIGGTIGITMGIGLAKLVEFAAFQAGYLSLKAVINLELIILAMGISFVFGMIFGIVPAIKAAKLKPVEAIRHG